MNPFENPEFLRRKAFYADTVACKKTDRVLVAPHIALVPMTLYGEVTVQDVMQDMRAGFDVFLRYQKEYDPDLAWGPDQVWSIPALELLDSQLLRWPGRHFDDPNRSFQVLDREYMKREEYEDYIDDPTGFMMRKLLPRHYAKLGPLESIDFSNPVWEGALFSMIPFALPHVKEMLAAMGDAGGFMLDKAKAMGDFAALMAENGWPMAMDIAGSVPFDLFNDTLRGLLNTSIDMLECPDLLLAAIEKATKIQKRSLAARMAQAPNPVVIFFLHNGMDTFMSREQFETFYWPGLKAMVDTVVENGGTAFLYTEEKYDAKLDLLATLPAGKVCVHLINSNMEKAKELFAGKICISGGVDGPMLRFGSPDDVVKDVKRAIDILAPGGGYFLNTSTSIDIAKPENLRALYDTARTYMKY